MVGVGRHVGGAEQRLRRGEWGPALRTVLTTPRLIFPLLALTAAFVLAVWLIDRWAHVGITPFIPAAAFGPLLGEAVREVAVRRRRESDGGNLYVPFSRGTRARWWRDRARVGGGCSRRAPRAGGVGGLALPRPPALSRGSDPPSAISAITRSQLALGGLPPRRCTGGAGRGPGERVVGAAQLQRSESALFRSRLRIDERRIAVTALASRKSARTVPKTPWCVSRMTRPAAPKPRAGITRSAWVMARSVSPGRPVGAAHRQRVE